MIGTKTASGGLRMVAYGVIGALAGVTILAMVAGAMYAITRPDKKAAEAVQAQGSAATASAGQAASQDAVKVVVDNSAIAAAIKETHHANAAAIRSAPGAADQLDPGLVRAAAVGLCRYESQRDDPACARLQQAHP